MTHDDDSRKVALILAQLKPTEGVKLGFGDGAEDAEDAEASLESQLEDVAAELVDAVKAGDTRAVAEALKAAFLVCDASPHVEGEHIGEDDDDEGASHELGERLGGHAYGGKARARYADGGTVGALDAGVVADLKAASMMKRKNAMGLGALDAGALKDMEAADMMKLRKEMALGALDEGAMRTLEAERKRRRLADALLSR